MEGKNFIMDKDYKKTNVVLKTIFQSNTLNQMKKYYTMTPCYKQ